ncbi:DUF4139 domain-containing protein [Sphingomonas sp. LY160]|uniref:DUF4139 domain-containing protein n=1 Tax=Sphingomonas sp. LY160 TaxID=3095342 RepID=UPI002ADEBADE|nr:DUF4139 domain-containing protein [Sphingomonas sp. LY160]MEA1072303.1 DUF4139 domain-containing protein [Sphingomonas sp. LY160]
MRMLVVVAALLASAPLFGQSAIQPVLPSPSRTAQGDVAITIYNDDRALIQDRRELSLPAGRSRQEFPDVSARIRPETVTLTGQGIGIIEQNFDFDLLTPAAMMQKAVGETVTLVRTNPANGAETRERARILAANGGVVMQIGNRVEVLRDDGLPTRVIFDRVPEQLRARPTLSITMETPRGGRQPVTLNYLSGGLGWSADYVALFDEANGRMDVQGWITLTNSSGTAFTNARTLLVAGEVGGGGRGYPSRGGMVEAGTENAGRERLGGFYLYPLPERTTIADKQTKQVSFLDVKGATAARAYEYRNGWLGTSAEPRSASSVLRFSSSRAAGLGDALPAGTVRVYQRDARGNPQFVGEHEIGHTPMGSNLSLATGEAFDVKVRPVVEERVRASANGARWTTRMRYTLTNAAPAPVTVDLVQDGLWGDVRVTAQSQEGERLNADQIRWKVGVPANGEAVVTATFDTRY